MSEYDEPPDDNPLEETGFVHLDFKQTFPHIFWTSSWGTNNEYPDGFRYKIFSIRYEPDNDFEVVLIHETHSGNKTEIQRWSVPPESIDATDDLVPIRKVVKAEVELVHEEGKKAAKGQGLWSISGVPNQR